MSWLPCEPLATRSAAHERLDETSHIFPNRTGQATDKFRSPGLLHNSLIPRQRGQLKLAIPDRLHAVEGVDINSICHPTSQRYDHRVKLPGFDRRVLT